jgi:hypothetical protein
LYFKINEQNYPTNRMSYFVLRTSYLVHLKYGIGNIERRTPNVELKHPITRMPYFVLACLPQAGYNILDT